NQPETREAARILALEDALETGAFSKAAAIKDLPEFYLAYAAQAAVVDGQSVDLRLTHPFNNALIDAARGRVDETTLLAMADDLGVGNRAHAYFALAMHAASRGDRATAAQYFRRSAARAVGHEFPYRAALENAKRFESNVAK
ncbi:MAG TPA: hypothetical protein VF787_22640, partial [Thermoanaerobaculia bacterium]